MKKVRCEDEGRGWMVSVYHILRYKRSILVGLVTKIVTPKIYQIHSSYLPNLNSVVESIIGNILGSVEL